NLRDGTSDSSFGALAGLDFDWQLARSLKLTQDANLVADTGGAATVFVDSNSTSVLLTTGLEAKISSSLSTRFSYTIDYDSNPPRNAVSTDTLSRFTLVYDFWAWEQARLRLAARDHPLFVHRRSHRRPRPDRPYRDAPR